MRATRLDRSGTILILVAALGAISCVDIDGGAIEVSWVLRTDDGRAVGSCDCADPALGWVRLVVTPMDAQGPTGSDICAERMDCAFPCGAQRGATPFFVAPGRYALSVAPVDVMGRVLAQGGTPEGKVRVPAPILRDVVFGQPTQLDAIAIQAGCAAACNENPTANVCAR